MKDIARPILFLSRLEAYTYGGRARYMVVSDNERFTVILQADDGLLTIGRGLDMATSRQVIDDYEMEFGRRASRGKVYAGELKAACAVMLAVTKAKKRIGVS